MKTTILILLMTIFLSCDSESKNEGFVIDTVVQMTLKNKNGEDLLNPNTVGTFNTDKIKIYYVDEDGKPQVYYESNLDYPKGYFIFKSEQEYKIKIFVNTDSSINNPTTIVKWNEEVSDNLKCEILNEPNREICTKVWVNDLLMYSDYSKERIINIIK